MKVWDKVAADIGPLDTLAKMGAYLKAIQQADDRFTGRAVKNITDAVKVRAMDFELPDEWMENPDLFLFKPYDEKLGDDPRPDDPDHGRDGDPGGQPLRRQLSSAMRTSRTRWRSRGWCRDFGRTEEAKRRYLEGKG